MAARCPVRARNVRLRKSKKTLIAGPKLVNPITTKLLVLCPLQLRLARPGFVPIVLTPGFLPPGWWRVARLLSTHREVLASKLAAYWRMLHTSRSVLPHQFLHRNIPPRLPRLAPDQTLPDFVSAAPTEFRRSVCARSDLANLRRIIRRIVLCGSIPAAAELHCYRWRRRIPRPFDPASRREMQPACARTRRHPPTPNLVGFQQKPFPAHQSTTHMAPVLRPLQKLSESG